MKIIKPLLALSLPLSLGIPVAPALAQAALEEIVVTAQKREESLQEVPIAVAALTNEGLERANVTRIEDLGNAVSGVIIENKGGYTVPKVRGIGTIIAGSGVYNAVATYVDDLYIARSYGNNLSIDDAESVQVLKGPQGALYGRNATSGAIVIKTKDPVVGSDVSGKFTAGYAEFDEVSLSGRLESGFGDSAAGSISGYYKSDDGKRKLAQPSQRLGSNDRTDITDEWGLNAKLVLEPVDAFRAVLKVGHTEFSNRSTYNNTATKEHLTAEEMVRINPAITPAAAAQYEAAGLNTFQLFAARNIYAAAPIDTQIALAQQTFASAQFGRGHDNLLNSFDLGHFNKIDAKDYHGGFMSSEDTYGSADLTYKFNRFDLVSITGYRKGSQGSATDVGDLDPLSPALVLAAGSPANNVGIGFSGQFETKDFQQEVRLQSNDTWGVQWIVGAHYFKEKSDLHWVDGNAFGTFQINTQNSWSNESTSGFAQATIPLTEQWSFTLGGRATDDKYRLTDRIDYANPPALPNVILGDQVPLGRLKQNESLETYLGRLEYQADEWMVYFGTSTGVKSGSLNNDGPAFGRAKPEKLVSYEAGFKSQWFGNSLRVNGALFHYTYKDPHIVFLDTSTGGQQLLNASDADALGFDLDVDAVINDKLTAYLNTTILNTEYKHDTTYVNGATGVTNVLASNGKDVAGAPDFSIVAGLEYRVPLSSMGDIFISPSVKYSAGNFYDVENRVGTGGGGPHADDGFTLVNLNARYQPSEGHWSAALWVKNLTDEEYYSSGQVASGLLFLTQTGDPRQFGGSITFEF